MQKKSSKGDAAYCFLKAACARMSLNAGIPARIRYVSIHTRRSLYKRADLLDTVQDQRVVGHEAHNTCYMDSCVFEMPCVQGDSEVQHVLRMRTCVQAVYDMLLVLEISLCIYLFSLSSSVSLSLPPTFYIKRDIPFRAAKSRMVCGPSFVAREPGPWSRNCFGKGTSQRDSGVISGGHHRKH